MQPVELRKFLRDLGRVCRKHGIALEIKTRPGSHRGLIFREIRTGQAVTLTIAAHREVSPGVQRAILKHAAELAAHIALAELITIMLRSILEAR